MNRFLRTAYSTTLVYLCLTLFGVLMTRAGMPFPAFSCLYFGLLLCLLPGIVKKLAGKERLFCVIGAAAALLGFIPIALLRCPVIHWIIHILGIAAAGAFLSLLRHRTTHSDFMAKYQFTAVLLLIVIGFVCLSLLTGIYTDGQTTVRAEALRLAMNNIVPFATVLLVTGVLLLRGLRAQEGIVDENAFIRRQLRDTLIFAVIITLVFLVDPFVYLQKGMFFLIHDVLQPAAGFIGRMLLALLRLLARPKQPEQSELPPEESTDPDNVPVPEPTETEPEQYDINDSDLSRVIAYIFIAVAALILLWILVRQIRKLIWNLRERSQKRAGGYPNEIRETLPPEEGTRRDEKPRRRSTDPRERIRYLYGDLLRHLKKLKMQISRSDTCGEIEFHAKRRYGTDSEAVSELTEIYERARYRLKEEPTEADARSMKDLVDRVRKRT